MSVQAAIFLFQIELRLHINRQIFFSFFFFWLVCLSTTVEKFLVGSKTNNLKCPNTLLTKRA